MSVKAPVSRFNSEILHNILYTTCVPHMQSAAPPLEFYSTSEYSEAFFLQKQDYSAVMQKVQRLCDNPFPGSC